mmetsp:Transcript_84771/g.213752  ORF Transcript_84771/g.213752 Transcript_84771/m.213752 type:complete len:225 (+) Transcript_84771:375-1049(+)
MMGSYTVTTLIGWASRTSWRQGWRQSARDSSSNLALYACFVALVVLRGRLHSLCGRWGRRGCSSSTGRPPGQRHWQRNLASKLSLIWVNLQALTNSTSWSTRCLVLQHSSCLTPQFCSVAHLWSSRPPTFRGAPRLWSRHLQQDARWSKGSRCSSNKVVRSASSGPGNLRHGQRLHLTYSRTCSRKARLIQHTARCSPTICLLRHSLQRPRVLESAACLKTRLQ